MLVVGLTGGIASGKSLVADYFASFGVAIADADVVARKVVEPNSRALSLIEEHFGADILQSDGNLNRAKLRQIIFSDNKAKKWLEDLLHPLIKQEQLAIIHSAKSVYSLLVTPLLIESGQVQFCDRLIVVVADIDIKIKRVMQRDGLNLAEAQNIINQQIDDVERLKFATDVITNNSDFLQVLQQVTILHNAFLNLAANSN